MKSTFLLPHYFIKTMLLKKKSISSLMTVVRLRWAGHVVQMDENKLHKKTFWTNPGGQQGHGRPKSRWINGVEEDARKLGCRNWLAAAQGRGRWRHLLKEAKAHPGL
jgi:hypothetical protein